MSIYEILSLVINFTMLIVALLSYIKSRKDDK